MSIVLSMFLKEWMKRPRVSLDLMVFVWGGGGGGNRLVDA